MKQPYLKPLASIIKYDIDESLMDNILKPEWSIEEDEDLG